VLNIPAPADIPTLAHDEILFWSLSSGHPPCAIQIEAPRQAHKRHTGKYAAGDVGERDSFYFRGPSNAVNLRAPNLMHFLKLAQDVDDATWEHHLRAKDYSAWVRHVIKDGKLAGEVAQIEADLSLDPHESRHRVSQAVSRRYAAPDLAD
jgi:hypothetical protein